MSVLFPSHDRDKKQFPTDIAGYAYSAQDIVALLQRAQDMAKKTRRSAIARGRGKKPYFFRRYRRAKGGNKSLKQIFADKYQGTDKEAFDAFYADTNYPKRKRDYQFGPAHAKVFKRVLSLPLRGQPTVRTNVAESKYYHKGLEAGIFDKQYLMDIISDEIEKYLEEKNAGS